MKDTAIIIAVDFDGVLHDYKSPIKDRVMGKPLPGAKEAMEKLVDRGFHVYIHTSKAINESGHSAVLDWLEYYDIPFHNVTSMKVNAALYIDDKSIYHTGWPSTLQQIEDRLGVKLDD